MNLVDLTEDDAATRARQQLRESERRFRLGFENAPIGIALVSPAGEFLDVNHALCRIVGYSRGQLLRLSFQDITHPADLSRDLALVEDVLRGRRQTYRMEKRYLHREGRVVDIQLDVSLVRDEEGEPRYFISQIQDISERRQYENALAQERELAQVTLAALNEGVIRTDLAGQISFCNEAAARLLGAGTLAARVVGASFEQAVRLYSRDDGHRLLSPLSVSDHAADSAPVTAQLATLDGSLRLVSFSVMPIRDQNQQPLGSVFVFSDRTARRVLADQLHFQSRHDPLTGLLNRHGFDRLLRQRLDHTSPGWRSHGLLFIDIDCFKLVNDTCGHEAGDRVLCALSALMRQHLRGVDLLARIGDDEFGVLLDGCEAAEAHGIAQGLIRAVEGYRYEQQGRNYQFSLSIGLVNLEPSLRNAAQLLAQADMACHIAKRKGGNRVQRYAANDADVSRAESDMQWIPRIEAAMAEGRMEVFAQRITALDSTCVVGHETLMRLREKSGEVVLPGEFLKAARRFGLMTRLDRWMVLEVQTLLSRSGQDLSGYLTINLSGHSLSDEDFASFLLRTLDESEVTPERLRFEITETDAFTSSATAEALVRQLRQRGYKVLLDDFGSGFLSFDQLRSLAADGLKIDRAYTRELHRDALNRTIIESICKISRQMGLEVIAEGVEDNDSLNVLREMGVQRVQGHLFHVAEPLRLVMQQPQRLH